MTAPTASDALHRGRAALRSGEFGAAREAHQQALDEQETPEALHGLAQALYWLGDYGPALRTFERAYVAMRARGETRQPAYLAALLAYEHLAVYGNTAISSGWRQRALRLAGQAGDCPERGWVELWTALLPGDPADRVRRIRAALRIAEAYDSADLRFPALARLGAYDVEQGRVETGLHQVDEAAAAASSGELTDPFAIGDIYCAMLHCCELTLDVPRAEQWMAAAEEFAQRSRFLPISAICRTHYGGILTAAGRWAEAEDELATAARIYAEGYRALRPAALVRLAELRLRQGRLDEAAQLLAGHERDPDAVRPLARLHLARGEPEVAATLL
ncbi:MAG: hypothetical protein ACRDT6_00855, partial [Micromonosporaceae bacterium]